MIKQLKYQEKAVGELVEKTIDLLNQQGERKRIVFNEQAIPAIAQLLAADTVDGRISVYVFSPGRSAYEDEWEAVADKVRLCALPAAIYDAYRRVLKPAKAKTAEAATEAETTEASSKAAPTLFNFDEEGGEA